MFTASHPGVRTAALLAATLLLAALLGVVGTMAALNALRPPSPHQYSAQVYLATDPAICPGDPLRVQSEVTVNAGPGDAMVVATFYRSVWSLDTDRTVINERAPISSIYTSRVTFTPVLVFTPTDTLAPGSYRLSVARVTPGFGTTGYDVYFRVMACER